MNRRTAAALIAVIGWTGLVLQVVTNVMRSHRLGMSTGEGLWQLAGYFTILTNTIVAVLFTRLALARPGDEPRWAFRPGVLGATTVQILFVGIAYSVLLRSTWHPQGLEIVADEIVHDVIPLLVLLYWWRAVEKGRLRVAQMPYWLLYPVAYLGYVLARGAVDGWYPYYFIDVTQLGYPTALGTAGAILVVFVVLCAGLIAVDRWLGRRGGVPL